MKVAAKKSSTQKAPTKGKVVYMILGGEKNIHRAVNSELDYLDLSIHGIPKSSIISIAEYLDIPMKDMADLVNLSPKTLERKKNTDLLSEVVSSQAIEIASTIAHGIEVFDDMETFKHWLNKENRAIAGKKPLEIMNTATGLKIINTILTRIEEGVYS
ncbi:putative toxin-antitoxin system antitoxin component (TIGR02293 family) [Chitinophaga skermanii]|uniref:Putative toxin-antitoxin system antitoxin component (TIGR02293 family) n=1 Tax=Chitinophaga skermanii TaxID=331697 RepID=A0A327R2S3_9BACT|nr:antitoxin Xre/MbcA/ParS toxin-binding domain-containing protein [Chitinophaga skermanii]RAJ10990.1 putative toxin-antitoxin system antitoxin component (TIGR02293 family) [Chitinophaga skermanii]